MLFHVLFVECLGGVQPAVCVCVLGGGLEMGGTILSIGKCATIVKPYYCGQGNIANNKHRTQQTTNIGFQCTFLPFLT